MESISISKLLIQQRLLLLLHRRYFNYLNVFLFAVFCFALYYFSKPFFLSEKLAPLAGIKRGVIWLFGGIILILPLLQLPKTVSSFFSDWETSFLLVHPVSLKHFYFLRFGEVLFGQFFFICLAFAVLARSYNLSQDTALLFRSILLLILCWFFIATLEVCLAFIFYRFFSIKKVFILAIFGTASVYGFQLQPQIREFGAKCLTFPASPFSLFTKFLNENSWNSLLFFACYSIFFFFIGLLLCKRFQLEFVSRATEADRSKRKLLFRLLYPLFSFLPLPVRSLLFRDIAILIRKGFARGGLVVVLLPIIVLFLIPALPKKPNPGLNELALLFIQVVLFALASFTLSIDFGYVLKEYRVWERATSFGAFEQFLASSVLCSLFNGFLAILVVFIGHFSKISTGIPLYEMVYLKSLILALSIGFFAGGFYLSTFTGDGGGDANTYGMSAAFVGMVLAFVLTFKPIWILIYPIYIISLYNQGKTRFEHLEVY